MRKYKVILFDIDDTLLDFDKAETNAIIDSLNHFDIEYDDSKIKLYKDINLKYWKEFEKGKTTIPELMVNRFQEFLMIVKKDLVRNAKEFNSYYLDRLNYGHDIIKDADIVIKKLINKYLVYPASNGIGPTQINRVESSALKGLFTKYYVSGFIGYQKPQKEFFDYIFNDLKNIKKEEFLMVGDSLTSDIKGGINAGIDTCWFNYRSKENKDVKPTYTITELKELLEILK